MTTSNNNSEQTFADINTVSDLVNANEDAKTPLAKVIDASNECNYTDTLVAATVMLTNLRDWNAKQAKETMEGRSSVIAYTYDTARLSSVLAILRPMASELLNTDEEESDTDTTEEEAS